MDKVKVLNNTTCFNEHIKVNKGCQKQACRHWISCKSANNCSIVASQNGSKTLQEIGDLCGLTRMRICQIEKSALKKIKEYMSKLGC